ncbi:hypothetical protein EVAR_11811_1 [Eumeta japonica]|uniref:Uncharacterized protein n=1 Tax=Eumeta variegata TaxID=151549 RepID=A0A4C1UPI1_EUMVA|nr:hypothetical protein EVAR_11811_1 [Eumeta japonica]
MLGNRTIKDSSSSALYEINCKEKFIKAAGRLSTRRPESDNKVNMLSYRGYLSNAAIKRAEWIRRRRRSRGGCGRRRAGAGGDTPGASNPGHRYNHDRRDVDLVNDLALNCRLGRPSPKYCRQGLSLVLDPGPLTVHTNILSYGSEYTRRCPVRLPVARHINQLRFPNFEMFIYCILTSFCPQLRLRGRRMNVFIPFISTHHDVNDDPYIVPSFDTILPPLLIPILILI